MSDLVLTYRGVVYPWHCDQMGHMNVMWYVSKFDEGTWQLLGMIGVTPAYMERHQWGVAAVEQKLTYQRELRAGDRVTVRSGILEIRGKVIRFYHEMRNDGTGEVAATALLTGVHMDTAQRKSCPFPDALIQQARALLVDLEAVRDS